MWNVKRLWRASAVSAAILLGVYLRVPSVAQSREAPTSTEGCPPRSWMRRQRIRHGDAHPRRRMLLGCPGRVPARARRR